MPKESLEINLAGIRLTRDPAHPLYLQLYDQLREMVLQQRLRPGDRLPASRNLAKELGVSRVIVNQAYEQLIMEGYLLGKTGAGTFVAPVLPEHLLNAPAAARSKRSEPAITGQEQRPFEIGIPSLDHFPYKIWQQVANKVLKGLKGYNLGYGDTLGQWELRKAIASYLRVARAVNCEAAQVIVVTGSQLGLNLITRSLLQKGEKVWMEDPGYPGARTAFQQAGAEICNIPIEEDGLDIRYAMEKCPEARMVYITPSHQFPLGRTLSRQKRLQLLQWARQHQMWILEDDYDSEFRYEGNPLASVQGLDTGGRVIYTGTFSKVLFPGLRLAYIVLPSVEMVEAFQHIKQHSDRQSPILEQLIVARFMEDGYFLRHIRKMRLLYAERQSILAGLLQEQEGAPFRLTVSPSGMHILCQLPERTDLPRFREAAKKAGLNISFINDYTPLPLAPTLALGFTAFSKYKMRIAVSQLMKCLELALSP